MSRRTQYLLLVLAVVGAVGAWRLGWLATTPSYPAPPVMRTPEPARFQAAWPTESDWLVDRVTRDIREMGALASGRALPAVDAPAVKAAEIEVKEHLLSPLSFEAIARDAAGGASAAARTDASGEARLLAALLEPRTGILLSEDLALSRELAARPADPGLHERAGLLLAAFALRATEGIFGDARPTLTRMTAHLALARTLRGEREPGRAGRLAEAALEVLVGRETPALSQLDALLAGVPSPEEKRWARALRLRTTGDWRIARDEKRLSLLETLEEFRALVLGQGDALALEWLDAREPVPSSAWGRIALCAASPSLGASNRFADLQVGIDFAETTEVLHALREAPADESAYFAALNESPAGTLVRDVGPAPGVAVVGWGLWASRLQQNLVSALLNGWKNRYMLGQPGERKAFAEQARWRFGRLTTYPLLLRLHAEDAESYRRAMAAVRELAVRSPERLMSSDWDTILAPAEFGPVPRDLPDPNQWFRPALAQGTLLDVDFRAEFLSELAQATDAQFAALRELAPHNLHLAMAAAGRLPADRRTAANLASLYGPLAEFHVPTMSTIAHAAWYDPADFRVRQGALCEIEARHCLRLGYRLAELGFPDEAAVAYQKGVEGTRDRVEAANQSRWLVDYYFDHGQAKKAEAVARTAAAVYSSAGLFTMARLMERMGRLREAEEHYRRILDRYREATELTGFYYRLARVARRPEYEARLRDALALALPGGLESLERASLAGPPADGVVVRGANDNTKRYGIPFGSVIVGLDGFRVRSVEAYETVRALSQSPQMKLVVWRGASYDDLDVELWDRRFRVDIETYAPPR